MTPLSRLLRPTSRLVRTVPSVRQMSGLGLPGKVGFIGLGNMGLPMVLNLAKETEVIAFDLNENSLKEAEQAGAQQAASIEEIGSSGSSVIFTMLPGCAAVSAVMPTLLDSAKDCSKIVFVDCSTVCDRFSFVC